MHAALPQSEYGDLYKVTLQTSGDAVSELRIKYFDTIPPCTSVCVLKTGFLFAASEFGNHALYQFLVWRRLLLSSATPLSLHAPNMCCWQAGCHAAHKGLPHAAPLAAPRMCWQAWWHACGSQGGVPCAGHWRR